MLGSAAPAQRSLIAEEAILKRPLVHLILVGFAAFAALVVTVDRVSPVFLERAPVVEQVIAHTYVDSTEIHAPWLSTPVEIALQTPQFLADRERFMLDLLRTGKVNESRAWRLADVAVSESYRRRLPPALVLGVMLTENDELKSSARSPVGAIGLMQIHARAWRSSLGRMFGTNLHDDSTNLRYGVFILGLMAKRAAPPSPLAAVAGDSLAAQDTSWRKALLRYNGCVRGRNTRDCHQYPATVQRNVIAYAKTTCNGRDFDKCVARPFWLSTRTSH